MKKAIYLLLFLTFTSVSYSQDDLSGVDTSKFENFDFDFYFEDPTVDHPTIILQYGMVTPNYHESVFTGDLANVGSVEAKLGFTTIEGTAAHPLLLEYEFGGLFLKYYNWELPTGNEDGIRTETWNFGFGSSTGYGYKLSESANIMLYNYSDINWSKINFLDSAMNSQSQTAIDDFGDAVRFGERFESGIRIQPIDMISVSAGYERAIIYPRHMFWYWALSEVVHAAGIGGIHFFIEAIKESSPMAVPVVNFVLKSALNYGIYELRKKDMNWPIETAPPFMYNSFKVGIEFTF